MKKETKIRKLLESGEKALAEQEPEGALERFLEAVEIDPENPEIHYYLGIAYSRLSRYERAMNHLERVLNAELSYINKVHAKMVLGYLYTLREEYDRALELFQGILKAGFNSAQAYAAVGYILDRMGRFKEAVMNLYRAIEIDPDNANAHNSLGYIYAEANVNLDQALEECKKALSLDADNPAYLDSIGWVYYKLGKISQAKSYLGRALKKASDNDEEIRKHLAIVSGEKRKPGKKGAPDSGA